MMRRALVVLATAAVLVAAVACAPGASPSPVASPLLEASPPASPAACWLGDCGIATLDPPAAQVGSTVAVVADSGYFGMWTPKRWAEWCGVLSINLHEPGDTLPGSGTLTPLTIVDDETATFAVPDLPAGAYVLFFSCGGDEAFGQPALPETFTVLAAGG
jgi:hypothetical protein